MFNNNLTFFGKISPRRTRRHEENSHEKAQNTQKEQKNDQKSTFFGHHLPVRRSLGEGGWPTAYFPPMNMALPFSWKWNSALAPSRPLQSFVKPPYIPRI